MGVVFVVLQCVYLCIQCGMHKRLCLLSECAS